MSIHQALNKLKADTREVMLAEQNFREKKYSLLLRPVDPLRDLDLLLSWLEDPVLEVNWGFRENSGRLSMHYKLFLESENRQSFMVEESGMPVFQFDIFLIHFHELYFRIPTTTGDCILNYVLLLDEEKAGMLTDALRLLLKYFFSFPGCRRLWMPVPETQAGFIRLFREAGFKYKTSYTARQSRYALFYLKMADYLPAQVLS
jgi:RimJ/RimL family protein N-acetyltransferase